MVRLPQRPRTELVLTLQGRRRWGEPSKGSTCTRQLERTRSRDDTPTLSLVVRHLATFGASSRDCERSCAFLGIGRGREDVGKDWSYLERPGTARLSYPSGACSTRPDAFQDNRSDLKVPGLEGRAGDFFVQPASCRCFQRVVWRRESCFAVSLSNPNARATRVGILLLTSCSLQSAKLNRGGSSPVQSESSPPIPTAQSPNSPRRRLSRSSPNPVLHALEGVSPNAGRGGEDLEGLGHRKTSRSGARRESSPSERRVGGLRAVLDSSGRNKGH